MSDRIRIVVAEALHAEGICNHAAPVPRSLATCPNRAGWLESAEDLLAEIRPLIEAELRESIAAVFDNYVGLYERRGDGAGTAVASFFRDAASIARGVSQ